MELARRNETGERQKLGVLAHTFKKYYRKRRIVTNSFDLFELRKAPRDHVIPQCYNFVRVSLVKAEQRDKKIREELDKHRTLLKMVVAQILGSNSSSIGPAFSMGDWQDKSKAK